VWGLSGKALAVLPMAQATGSAKVKGQEANRQVFGLGDPLLRVSVNRTDNDFWAVGIAWQYRWGGGL
jgi:hypothetical protein